MCVYLYLHNKYTQYTHILCKQKLLFWMRLIANNRLTALILIYIKKFLFTEKNIHFNIYIYMYIYIYIYILGLSV